MSQAEGQYALYDLEVRSIDVTDRFAVLTMADGGVADVRRKT